MQKPCKWTSTLLDLLNVKLFCLVIRLRPNTLRHLETPGSVFIPFKANKVDIATLPKFGPVLPVLSGVSVSEKEGLVSKFTRHEWSLEYDVSNFDELATLAHWCSHGVNFHDS